MFSQGHLGCIKAILHAVESKSTSHFEHCNGVWLAQDVRGVTPLHHAAVHNNYKCLQALLKYAVPGTLDTEDHKKVVTRIKTGVWHGFPYMISIIIVQ